MKQPKSESDPCTLVSPLAQGEKGERVGWRHDRRGRLLSGRFHPVHRCMLHGKISCATIEYTDWGRGNSIALPRRLHGNFDITNAIILVLIKNCLVGGSAQELGACNLPQIQSYTHCIHSSSKIPEKVDSCKIHASYCSLHVLKTKQKF